MATRIAILFAGKTITDVEAAKLLADPHGPGIEIHELDGRRSVGQVYVLPARPALGRPSRVTGHGSGRKYRQMLDLGEELLGMADLEADGVDIAKLVAED